ncbi:MAG TPA: CAP domain-containing protein [Sphingobium sp.]|nr:CAP domain-containing protein [Sphingobium sp.]
MSASRLKARAAACALAAAAPFVVSAADPLANFDERLLFVHNRERAELDLPPLQWNATLERTAQRWADYLAQTGRFEHAPENMTEPQGENLWAGTKGYYAPEQMVDAWAREKRYFRPGLFPDNSTTGRLEDIGHYTQLVWRATRQVGCARATSQEEDILVCRYAEAGNYTGEEPF